MTSLIHMSQLSPSDLARLGNNLPRKRRRTLSQFWHTEPIRRSLAVFEPDLMEDDADLHNGQPECADTAAA